MAAQVTPPAPIAHVPSEIQVAVTYLSLYQGLYNVPDLSNAGLCRLLMGFRNYLDTLPSSSLTFSGSLATLISKGFV
jgi:hypothetical protein